MRLDVVSIFPDYLAPLDLSLIGKARRDGIIDVRVHDLRDFTHDRHRTVDDTPYGGGAGMVMKPQPWSEALTHVLGSADEASGPAPILVVPGPGGQRFDQARARELAEAPWLAFACGRYEGIDERVYEWAAERMEVRVLSLGDYVLNGGEVAVLAMTEAIVRLLPGVVGNAESLVEESHEGGLLEYPIYTKPSAWTDAAGVTREVPEVLLGGNHEAIATWRHEQRLARTAARRPDLLAAAATAQGPDGLSVLDHAVATPADAGEILTLQKACRLEMVAEPQHWSGAPAETVDDVRADLASWTTHTFRSEGRLVASVRVRRDPVDPSTWQIGRLMVVPDLQGRGLERALLERAEALGPADITRYRLSTGADQQPLLRMSKKAGYRTAGPGEGPGTVDLTKRRAAPPSSR
ncbi:tRNA (guanosine(37)-N1)-methyltransferase TrmD [Janibacter sp. YIM B02568]|uniref:tRNA (guanosine(37)-N1)-methyltransferase TrmD n=1 Tax=Janibacter endophyticus TaxID=2806261 RepID=UPI00194DD052|nr:tRNA (guanosine(37)-N1)-methyltransferase TrmD [Janibacter endophyticus]MBM6545919.1 tRNA (guanosine(37)-N1)-methyltransferase TrmD [Janibacter endophyticus]